MSNRGDEGLGWMANMVDASWKVWEEEYLVVWYFKMLLDFMLDLRKIACRDFCWIDIIHNVGGWTNYSWDCNNAITR